MFCPKCGKRLFLKGLLCSKCGYDLAEFGKFIVARTGQERLYEIEKLREEHKKEIKEEVRAEKEVQRSGFAGFLRGIRAFFRL